MTSHEEQPRDDAPSAEDHSALLEFIYLSPFALVRIDAEGHIEMMNAVGAQVLMEFAADPCVTNLFTVFADVAPELRGMVAGFTDERGVICEGHRVEVRDTSRELPLVLSLTLLKLTPTRVMVAIADISRLEAANRAKSVLLDNVSDGLVTLDAEGRMANECSAALVRWLGAPAPGAHLWEHAAAVDPRFAADFRAGWEQLRDGFLPAALCLDQLPGRMTAGARPLGVTYTALFDDEALTHVMVVIRDLTAELERERLEREQRDLMAAVNRLSADRQGFRDFVVESTRLVDEVVAGACSTTQIARDVHTLKGNAGIFGLSSVAKLCHEIEDRLRDHGGVLDDDDRAALRESWGAASSRLSLLLGDRQKGVTVRLEDFHALLRAVERRAPHDRILRLLARLELSPVGPRLEHFAAHARDLAARLGKAPLRVTVEGAEVLHDARRMSPFWSAFAHAVRNAVDHGVEAPDERARLGKGDAHIVLAASQGPRGLVVSIHDDGHGVSWARIAERAQALGRPARTHHDLVDALFADGLSTAEELTDVSGRGVGLGALRAACEALGGAIAVDSPPGQGTTFRFTIPHAEAAAGERPRARARRRNARPGRASLRGGGARADAGPITTLTDR